MIEQIQDTDNVEMQDPQQPEPKLSVADFAKKIKEKYPVYKDINDSDLVSKIVSKYPVYKDKIDFEVKAVTQPSSTKPTPAPTPEKQPTTIQEDNDPISLATNISKLSKEGEFLGAAGTGGGGGSFVQSKSAAEKTVANKEKLKQIGYKDEDIAKINEEWSDFPEEALNVEVNDNGTKRKLYTKAQLSELRKNDYQGYLNRINAIKTFFNIRKSQGNNSAANEFARLQFTEPTGNFYNDLVKFESNKKTQEDIINSTLEGEDREKAINRLNQSAESWANRSIVNSEDAKQAIQAKLETKNGITVDIAAFDVPELKEYLDLNNPVEKVLYDKYKNGVDLRKSLEGSANLDEAAMKYWMAQDDKLKGQIEMSGDLPNNTKGELVNAFLENSELKEMAKNNPELAKMYQQTKYNIAANYPDYAKRKVGQAIGQELENSGATNWFANIPTQEEVDKVVDKLVESGKLSEQDRNTYSSHIKDELGYLQSIKRGVGRIPFGAFVEKSPIPTSGFLENTLEGFNETMRGTARSIEDIVSFTNPALRKVFSDDKRMYNVMQENSALQHIVPKTKLHEISEGTGHLAGFMAGMLATGGILSSVKAGHLINNALMFEGANRDKALMEFPDDVKKRYLYTALATAGDVMLGELIPTKAVSKAVSNSFKSDIKGIVSKLADNSISSGEAKEALLKRAAELFPDLVLENAKTAGIMTGFGAFHNALDSIFGVNDMNLQDIAQEAIKSYKSTFLTTPLLSAFAVYGKNKKVGSKILLEIADNPELYKKQIEEAALTDKTIAENKEEALQNLDALVSVSNSLEGTKLTEQQKEKYVVNAMAEKVWERKALNTSEENIASDYRKKAQEFRDKKEAIYKGEDKATDYEKYDTNNPQEVFTNKNEQPTQEVGTDIQPTIEEAKGQELETAVQPSTEPMGKGTAETTPTVLEAPRLKGEPEQISQPIELSLEPQNVEKEVKVETTNEETKVPIPTEGESKSNEDVNKPIGEAEKTEGKGEEGKLTLNKDNKVEFVTKSKRQKVTFVDGDLDVVDAKTGKQVDAKTKKKALQEYADAFDFSVGKEVTEFPEEVKTTDDAIGYTIENSENPYQLANIYVAEEPTLGNISTVERMIADFGIGKIKGKSYNQFGDRNNMTLGKARRYINKDGRSIDVVAAEMSDHYGVEITPQDVVSFMDKFPDGEQQALRMVENANARQAADKFKKLTGLTLNNEVAKIVIEKEFNKLKKEQQSLAEQDYENARQLEEAYWEQFAKTDGFTKESPISETKQAETKGENKPPIEPPTEVGKGIPKESKGTQLSFKGLQEVADDFGLDPIRSKDRKTDTDLMKESENLIKDWMGKGTYEKNVSKLIKRANENGTISDVERVVLEQHIANLRAELSSISDVTSKEYSEGLKYLQEVVKAGNKARSAAGAALRIPSFDSVPKYDMPSMMVRKMEALNVEELTETQKLEIKSQYEEIEKRAKDAEEKVAELEKKIAEQNAKMALETKHKPKKGIKSGTPKTKEDYKAERKNYLEELKAAKEEHLKWLKDNGISNASILPNGGIVLTNKMAGIILKIVRSHVEEVGNDLKQITIKTFEDVKALFEGITEQDIHDVIAGVYSKKEKTLSELQRDVKDLREEAKLINDLKALMSGDESKMSENKKRERNQKIKDLKDKIKTFKDESGLTEKQKIEAAEKRAEQSIKELERQISENDILVKQAEKTNSPKLEQLRKEQKRLREEIEELRKEAKEGKYSDLSRLEQVRKSNERAEQKIREKIANKEFDTEEKPTIMQQHEVAKKFPKEYKEAMDAIIAKEDAQHEYEMALVKDEMARRSKFKKFVVDPAKMIINTVSALKSGIDNSFVFVQGGLAALANPAAAAKAMSRQVTDFFSEKAFDRDLAALHNDKELWSLIERSGLDILDPKSLREGKRDEVLGKKNLLNSQFKIGNKSITIGKYLTAPFERLYTSMGNNLRLNIFLQKVEQMQSEGKTIDNSLKEYQDIARVVNEMTGRGKLHKKLESGTEALSTVIWSPKLLASSINLLGLGDVGNFIAGGNKGYYRGLSSPKFDIKNVKKSVKDWNNSPQAFAIKQTASGFGMGFAIMALWALNPDKEVDTDPTSVTFGTVKDKVSGNSYNIFGRFTSLARLIAMLLMNKKTIQGEEIKLNETKGGKTTGEETWRFLRGKFNPVAGEVTDAFIIKKTFDGKPYTVNGFGERMLVPMSVVEISTALEQQGWGGIFKRGIPSFYGIKVSNEADFKKDDLHTSKDEVLKEKSIYMPKLGDKTQYKVDITDEHPEGVMTNEEFTTFSELLKSKFDENVNQILSATFDIKVEDPEENVLVDKSVLGKDLPKDNLQDRINEAKKKAVEESLKEMGLVKPKNTTTIKKQD